MNYGIISLLPALVVILFALITRRTFEALLAGTFVTYIILSGPGFLTAWIDTFFEVAVDPDVQWIVIVCALFGSLIELLKTSNATAAFSEKLSKLCKSGRSSLLMTWFLGILIFIDDYLNIITLGNCMRSLTDKYDEPREALAYIIDSTGAPVCVLLPFSTWAIFYSSIFFEQPEIAALGYKNPISMYLRVIPFTFYAIFTLLVVLLFCLKLLPKIGRMKTAYEKENILKYTALKNEKAQKCTVLENGTKMEEGLKEGKKGTVWDFLIPLVLLIAITVINGDLFVALIISLAVCFVLYIPRKLMSFNKFCDAFMDGFCSLIPTIAVVFVAYIMQHASNDIGLPSYVITTVAPLMNKTIFPALAFVIVSALTFVTGSNWGIPAVCTPIIIPLGAALGVNPLLTMAAVLSGGTFGSHACFYSDATMLTSQSCGINNMDHALSQIPYAIIGAGLSCIAFLVCGGVM